MAPPSPALPTTTIHFSLLLFYCVSLYTSLSFCFTCVSPVSLPSRIPVSSHLLLHTRRNGAGIPLACTSLSYCLLLSPVSHAFPLFHFPLAFPFLGMFHFFLVSLLLRISSFAIPVSISPLSIYYSLSYYVFSCLFFSLVFLYHFSFNSFLLYSFILPVSSFHLSTSFLLLLFLSFNPFFSLSYYDSSSIQFLLFRLLIPSPLLLIFHFTLFLFLLALFLLLSFLPSSLFFLLPFLPVAPEVAPWTAATGGGGRGYRGGSGKGGREGVRRWGSRKNGKRGFEEKGEEGS